MKYFGQSKDVALKIVEAFQKPELLPQALAPIFIHRHDDIPCRKWSWHNQLLVALAGSIDARGFQQWHEAGRYVKKGSKAIWILAPCIKTVDPQNEDEGEIELGPRRILYGFRSVPVFAVEDTDGEPLPECDAQHGNWLKELPLVDVAKSWGINVGTYSGGENLPLGYFRPGERGQAVMLGVRNLSTWAHELVHAADHRLTGLKGERALLEIVAELGSAVLLKCLGLPCDADLGGAYAYIDVYASESSRDVLKGCMEVLDRVCNAVDLILRTAETLSHQEVMAV